MSLFFAPSLAAIAEQFRRMADKSDTAAKTVTTRRERLDAEVAARVWRDAAAVLDQTSLHDVRAGSVACRKCGGSGVEPEDTRTQDEKDYEMDRYSPR
jgi:hypothetical protein